MYGRTPITAHTAASKLNMHERPPLQARKQWTRKRQAMQVTPRHWVHTQKWNANTALQLVVIALLRWVCSPVTHCACLYWHAYSTVQGTGAGAAVSLKSCVPQGMSLLSHVSLKSCLS
jgi:hypothetical protein